MFTRNQAHYLYRRIVAVFNLLLPEKKNIEAKTRCISYILNYTSNFNTHHVYLLSASITQDLENAVSNFAEICVGIVFALV